MKAEEGRRISQLLLGCELWTKHTEVIRYY